MTHEATGRPTMTSQQAEEFAAEVSQIGAAVNSFIQGKAEVV